jgi:GT2 family glycosyltransferase
MLPILPPITVVVATKDRGERVVETIQTILLNDYPDFEVRVIDQSVDNLTEASLQPFKSDSRFCYERTGTWGLSTGRNLGVRAAKNELIAATDDDCKTPPNWLRELAAAFAVDHRIGVVFGNTRPGPHDSCSGFIPSYMRKEPFLARSIREKHRVEGIGACMGLKKSVWQVLGGFDELLGPGAPFKAADDTDFTIRALLAGYYVYETPAFMVFHTGFRTWGEGRVLIYGYLYGLGATFAKHLKRGQCSILFLLLHLISRWALRNPAVDFGHCPPRWLRLQAFLRGFLSGASHPVDPRNGHFLYC